MKQLRTEVLPEILTQLESNSHFNASDYIYQEAGVTGSYLCAIQDLFPVSLLVHRLSIVQNSLHPRRGYVADTEIYDGIKHIEIDITYS